MSDMTLDEAIENEKSDIEHNKSIGCDTSYEEQRAEWLEELKTIENIMLIYNANWYADEDNGVPDCEVLESIWNVIQDNGFDIDIEQDYRKGKSDGYNKAIDDFVEKLNAKCDGMIKEKWNSNVAPISWAEAYADFKYDIYDIAEQLKAGVTNE